jgi:hypothetical protein
MDPNKIKRMEMTIQRCLNELHLLIDELEDESTEYRHTVVATSAPPTNLPKYQSNQTAGEPHPAIFSSPPTTAESAPPPVVSPSVQDSTLEAVLSPSKIEGEQSRMQAKKWAEQCFNTPASTSFSKPIVKPKNSG